MQPGSLPAGPREAVPGTVRSLGSVGAHHNNSNNSNSNTTSSASGPGAALVHHNTGTPTLQAMPSLLSPPQQQHHQPMVQFEHAEHAPAPPAMDEFLEQMFSLPPWNDVGGGGGVGSGSGGGGGSGSGSGNGNGGGGWGGASAGGGGGQHGGGVLGGLSHAAGAGGGVAGAAGNAGRVQWELGNSNAAGAAAAAARLGVDPHKFITMSLLPIGAHTRADLPEGPDASGAPQVGDSVLYGNEDNILGGATRMRGLQDNSASAPGLGSRAGGVTTLTRSPSVGSSGSEGSEGPQSPPPIAPTWRQPYVGGVPPLPLGLGQTKPESLLRVDSGDAHLLGKRSRDEDDVSMRETHSGSNLHEGTQGLFASFSSGNQVTQTALPRTAGPPSHQQGNGASSQAVQSGQTISIYGGQTVAAQPQTGAGVATISGRPRVRARRGQATDPHSIAERLRRERIAERMKALQELVPNSNKTDKASMLDEIIDYVKFLQLQVKVLSMSRLGGAGAVAPLVADLPSEGPSSYVTASMNRTNGGPGGPSQDGLALTERQVARLMEEDMGSAMQYLQSKGLCLMPISLATAISSTNSRSQGGNQSGGAQRSDQSASPAAAMTVSNATLTNASQAGATPVIDVDASQSSPGATNIPKDARDVGPDKMSAGSSSRQSPKAKPQFKGKEDTPRRSQ